VPDQIPVTDRMLEAGYGAFCEVEPYFPDFMDFEDAKPALVNAFRRMLKASDGKEISDTEDHAAQRQF
jgi:hypothetical protein